MGLALPLLGANVLQQLYNIANSLVVTWYLGEQSLAALGIAESVMNLYIYVITGACMGAGVLVARFYAPFRSSAIISGAMSGLRPAVVKENPALYLSFAAFCLFSVAVQVFFPYLIIYMQNYLHFDGYALVLGIVLIFASVVSVLSGRVIDRLGELTCVLPAAGVMFAGLVGMFFARSMPAVIVTGCVMMSGYMLVTAILSGVIRDHTPAGKAGHFQGIRMIFGVLLPMILGPAIGAAVIRGSDSTYVDLGVVKTVPTPSIFLAAAVVLLLILPPGLALRKKGDAAC